MLDLLNGTGLMTRGPQPGFPHGDLRGKASLQGVLPLVPWTGAGGCRILRGDGEPPLAPLAG